MSSQRILVAGGAGFIGSHVVERLLASTDTHIIVYDNFSCGVHWHLDHLRGSPRLEIIAADLKDLSALSRAAHGVQLIYHFASNPDIAKAMTQPDIDFWEGTYLTQNILEAARLNNVPMLIYASGSGVYGDAGDRAITEDHSACWPISPYGASKLAGEALIHAYCHMFGVKGRIYRFANVVGPRQTHGVAYDFLRKLAEDPENLTILGDGSQSKSYIHVSDVVDALECLSHRTDSAFAYYHLATEDYITVSEIADLVVSELNLHGVKYKFTGGDRGWRGDVPIVRFNCAKAHRDGWRAKLSTREAMRASIRSMLAERRDQAPIPIAQDIRNSG